MLYAVGGGLVLAGVGAAVAMSMQMGDEEVTNTENKPIAVTTQIAVTTSASRDTPNLPAHVPYLLVGGGTASFAAYRAIRAVEPGARILVIGEEERLPYMRPPLSKEMWFTKEIVADEHDVRFKQWNGRDRSLYFEPRQFYSQRAENSKSEEESVVKEGEDVKMDDKKDEPKEAKKDEPKEAKKDNGINVVTGHKVVKIDATKQVAHLDNGRTITYDKCLLATGEFKTFVIDKPC
jgi:programmed cell death 8 (apoptosis-inducing factor)